MFFFNDLDPFLLALYDFDFLADFDFRLEDFLADFLLDDFLPDFLLDDFLPYFLLTDFLAYFLLEDFLEEDLFVDLALELPDLLAFTDLLEVLALLNL